jgi:hypothetical protein
LDFPDGRQSLLKLDPDRGGETSEYILIATFSLKSIAVIVEKARFFHGE